MANEAVGVVVLAIVLAIPVFQMKLDIWIGYYHYYGYYHYFCCCSYCYGDYSYGNDTNIGTIYTNCFKVLRGSKMKIFLACGLYRHQRK